MEELPAGSTWWPRSPLATAIHWDGTWLPSRGIVTGLGGAGVLVLAAVAEIPVVGGVPVPAMSLPLVLGALVLGLLDARAGSVLGVLAVAMSVGDATTPTAWFGLGVQLVVVSSLSGLVALAVTELGREAARLVSNRARGRLRTAAAVAVAVGAIAWILVNGWVAAAPILLGSALPHVELEELVLGPEFGLLPVAALLTAIARRTLTARRPRLPRPVAATGGVGHLLGQFLGGGLLLLLVSSLFRGTPLFLISTGTLLLLVRLIRIGWVPPVHRALGPRWSAAVTKIPPLTSILGVTGSALLLGWALENDVASIRWSLLICLVLVLVLSSPDAASPAPERRRRAPKAVTASIVLLAVPLVAAAPAFAQETDGSHLIESSSLVDGTGLLWTASYTVTSVTFDEQSEVWRAVVSGRAELIDTSQTEPPPGVDPPRGAGCPAPNPESDAFLFLDLVPASEDPAEAYRSFFGDDRSPSVLLPVEAELVTAEFDSLGCRKRAVWEFVDVEASNPVPDSNRLLLGGVRAFMPQKEWIGSSPPELGATELPVVVPTVIPAPPEPEPEPAPQPPAAEVEAAPLPATAAEDEDAPAPVPVRGAVPPASGVVVLLLAGSVVGLTSPVDAPARNPGPQPRNPAASDDPLLPRTPSEASEAADVMQVESSEVSGHLVAGIPEVDPAAVLEDEEPT